MIEKDIEILSKSLGINTSEQTKMFFKDEERNRISEKVFKNYYAPGIIFRKNQLEIVPLRFNLLPHFCLENKYLMIDKKSNKKKELNTYNAKIESLEQTKAYRSLFLNHHCIIPIKGFYEWGKIENNKVNLNFYKKDKTIMFAAGLWDHWNDGSSKLGINSFSIITTTPRAEVEEMGHHRSPVLLSKQSINSWVNTKTLSKDFAYSILKNQIKERLETSIVG